MAGDWLMVYTPLNTPLDWDAMRAALGKLTADDFQAAVRYWPGDPMSTPEFCATMKDEIDSLEEWMAESNADGYLYRRMDTTTETMWQFFTTYGVGDDECGQALILMNTLVRLPAVVKASGAIRVEQDTR